MFQVGEVRVLHIPCNTPAIRNLRSSERIDLVNDNISGERTGIPAEVSFGWITAQHNNPAFWNAFDVCHINFGFEFEKIEIVSDALQLLQVHGKPIVYTYHEPSSVHGVNDTEYQRFITTILQFTDAVVVMTEDARAHLIDHYADTPHVVIIPKDCVIMPDHQHFGHASARGLAPEVVLFGALRPNRDLPTAFVNLALGLHGECRVTLITRAFTRQQLETSSVITSAITIASGGLGSIEPSLPISDEEMAGRLRTADVLVLPYHSAGHSGQLEMAYDCGLIPVATNVGFLESQSNAWSDEKGQRPPVVFVDWQDGREWMYQSRLLRGVREALRRLNDFQPWNVTEHRREYRREVHERIVELHYRLYLQILTSQEGQSFF